MAKKPGQGVMRSLGQFVGHIVRGAKADVSKPKNRAELHREVQEHEREIDGRSVVVRRTTIEEIEVKDDQPQPQPEPKPEPETEQKHRNESES